MEDLLFTRDGRYVSGLNRIIDVETGLYTDINNPNPIFICEMFRNESLFIYKNSIMESTKLFSNMRKLLYRLMESDMNVIMEYEIKFGRNLIVESNKSLLTEQIISDSWDFVKNKIFEKYPTISEGFFGDLWDKTKSVAGKVWDKTKEVAGKAWEGIKDAGAWVLNKGLPWIMEKIEHFMMSPVGIGLDVALTALGIGKLATGIVWGILFVWKVYQLLSGKTDSKSVWTYIDLAVCLAGVIFSGAAKGLKAAFKAAGGSVMKVGGKILQPIITVLSKGLGGIMNILIKPLEWIAKAFGNKATSMISSFKSGVGKVLENMKNVFAPAAQKAGVQGAETLTSLGKKFIKKDFTNPIRAAVKGKGPVSTATAVRKGLTWGAGTAVAMKGMEKGAQYFAGKGGEQGGSEKSQEDLSKIAQVIPDEEIKQGVEQDMENLLNQMQ